jgi:hypothetical protein
MTKKASKGNKKLAKGSKLQPVRTLTLKDPLRPFKP